jgi:1-acyl-sn-glycerol-3-phosphate acyltransferase
MKTNSQILPSAAPPDVSGAGVRLFAAYSRRYVRRHFHTIRVLKSGLPECDPSRPLVIYLNHASWWDPLVCLRLSQNWFADRNSFAPIDAAALRRYGFFKHLGFYGVEQKSLSGARSFLRTTQAILGSEQNVVWLTPQGRFADVRERPARLQNGLGALAALSGDAVFMPLAIEYAFWTESCPEILVSFGKPVVPGKNPLRASGEWTEFFSSELEGTMDELAAGSRRRDPAEWLVLDRGASGTGPVYDAWRWLRTRMSGGKFAREHQPEGSA